MLHITTNKLNRGWSPLNLGCMLWALATVVSAVMLSGCGLGDSDSAVEAPPIGVLVAKVSQRKISETVEYVGQTLAVNDVSLRTQVEGYLLERNFREGQDVEKGAELFLIDPVLYKAEVAAADGAVAQTQAAVSRAEKDVKRYKELIKQQNVSQQKLDEVSSMLLQEQANLKTVKARLEKAQINLSHTIIKAPISGRIGRSAASVGDLVNPQTGELARLVELDPIYASFSVSEVDVIAAKRKNQIEGLESMLDKIEVRLRLPDGSMYDQIGRVDFIDNVVDRRTGTIVMRARFDNPRNLLVPGLYVSTSLGTDETSDKLVIPQAAVQEDQAGAFVLVVTPDSKVERRRITTGKAYAGELVVEAGLEPDEEVIVEGIQKVRPGAVVDARLAPRPTLQQETQTPAPNPAVESQPDTVDDATGER
jgi:membrane fusion protein (multidrug efflux system)